MVAPANNEPCFSEDAGTHEDQFLAFLQQCQLAEPHDAVDSSIWSAARGISRSGSKGLTAHEQRFLEVARSQGVLDPADYESAFSETTRLRALKSGGGPAGSIDKWLARAAPLASLGWQAALKEPPHR